IFRTGHSHEKEPQMRLFFYVQTRSTLSVLRYFNAVITASGSSAMKGVAECGNSRQEARRSSSAHLRDRQRRQALTGAIVSPLI
ncbi:hypothetical protein, partial [Aeromonas rivuli]|uniref:hypothetical protein n=1 Tax=Aeromonas rivuli TaxID=648794 RepID=UPI001E3051DE